MKTIVEFRSGKFPPYADEEHELGPGHWGRRLAEYLSEGLGRQGIATGEIVGQNGGCYIPVPNERFRLALMCGHRRGEDEQFQIVSDPKFPTFRKLMRRVDATPQLRRLLGAVEEILAADPEISGITWRRP